MPPSDDLNLHNKITTVKKPPVTLTHHLPDGNSFRYYASADPEERIFFYTSTFASDGSQRVNISADLDAFLADSSLTGYPTIDALLAGLRLANPDPNPYCPAITEINAYYPSDPQFLVHATPPIHSVPVTRDDALRLHQYLRDVGGVPAQNSYTRKQLVSRWPEYFITKSAASNLVGGRDLKAKPKSKKKKAPTPLEAATDTLLPDPTLTSPITTASEASSSFRRRKWLLERGAIPRSVHAAALADIRRAFTFTTTLNPPDAQYLLPHLLTTPSLHPTEYPIAVIPPSGHHSHPTYPFFRYAGYGAGYHHASRFQNNLRALVGYDPYTPTTGADPSYVEQLEEYNVWNQSLLRNLKYLLDPSLVLTFPYRSITSRLRFPNPVLHFLKYRRSHLVSLFLSHYTSYIPQLQNSVSPCDRLQQGKADKITSVNQGLARHLLMLSRYMGFRSYPESSVASASQESSDVE